MTRMGRFTMPHPLSAYSKPYSTDAIRKRGRWRGLSAQDHSFVEFWSRGCLRLIALLQAQRFCSSCWHRVSVFVQCGRLLNGLSPEERCREQQKRTRHHKAASIFSNLLRYFLISFATPTRTHSRETESSTGFPFRARFASFPQANFGTLSSQNEGIALAPSQSSHHGIGNLQNAILTPVPWIQEPSLRPVSCT